MNTYVDSLFVTAAAHAAGRAVAANILNNNANNNNRNRGWAGV